MLTAWMITPSIQAHGWSPQAPHAKAIPKMPEMRSTAPTMEARSPREVLPVAAPMASPDSSSVRPPKMPKTPPIAARMARIVTPVGRSRVAGDAEVVAAAGGGGLAGGGVGSDAIVGSAGGGANGSGSDGGGVPPD